MSDIDHTADETIPAPTPITDYDPPADYATSTVPLTADERNRLSYLRGLDEKVATEADAAEMTSLEARENIPEQAPKADPPQNAGHVVHSMLGDLAGMLEHLAGVLPAASPLTARLVAFRHRLAGLKEML